jgi:uncharacterized protein (DUF4415 family)
VCGARCWAFHFDVALPPLAVGKDFWKRARVVMPSGKTSVHLRINSDSDVFEWFKRQGQGHLTRMHAVLRSYVDAQKH